MSEPAKHPAAGGQKTVFVTGGRGVVGTAILDVFKRRGWRIFAPDSGICDVRNEETIRRLLAEARPQLIVNCAGIAATEACELAPQEAFAVNSLAVKTLAREATALGATLVQISSAAVFGNEKKLPHSEDDVPAPVNIYGGSKFLGERLALAWCPRTFVIRLPMLYGERKNQGAGFIERMAARVRRREPCIFASTDEFASPAWSMDAATVIERLAMSNAYGTYHVSAAGFSSLHGIATCINDSLHGDSYIRQAGSADFPRTAKTTPQGALTSLRLPSLPDWRERLCSWLVDSGLQKED